MTVGAAPVMCDNCGKDRRDDTNHWMTLIVQGDPVPVLIFTRGIVADKGKFHACGHNCASILLAEWMAEGKLS